MNDPENPQSLRVYRAGVLLDPNAVTPTVTMQIEGSEVVIEWTGMLQSTGELGGTWTDVADDSESPLRLPLTSANSMFVRSRTD
jgi:hypothetical protein